MANKIVQKLTLISTSTFIMLLLVEEISINSKLSKYYDTILDSIEDENDETCYQNNLCKIWGICNEDDCMSALKQFVVKFKDLPQELRLCKGKVTVTKVKGKDTLLSIKYLCNKSIKKNNILANLAKNHYNITKTENNINVTKLFLERDTNNKKSCYWLYILDQDNCICPRGIYMAFASRPCDVYQIKLWPYSEIDVLKLPYEYFKYVCYETNDNQRRDVWGTIKAELRRCADLLECMETDCKSMTVKYDWMTGYVEKMSVPNATEEDKQIIECVNLNKLVLEKPEKSKLIMTDYYHFGKKCKKLERGSIK